MDLAAIGGIASGVGGLMNYFGGSEDRAYTRDKRKREQELYAMLQGMLKQPGISQGQINSLIPNMQKGMAPYMNKLAGNASSRLGLDSGAAQGEIARGGAGQLQQQLGGVQQQAMFQNANRPMQIARLMAMLGG